MLALLLRYITPAWVLFIAMLVFYEGVPVISRLPLVAEILPSGLLKGRVQTYAEEKTQGLVSGFELQSARRQLEVERNLRKAAEDSLLSANARAAVSDALAAQRQEKIEELSRQTEGLPTPTEEELEWLKRF